MSSPQTSAIDRRDSAASIGFLSLGPVTSSSFPAPPATNNSNGAAAPTARRSSSLSSSSDGAKTAAGFKILKLGPVHYGEHQDAHKGDWCEVAVE